MRKIRTGLRVGADGARSAPVQTDVAAQLRTTNVKEDIMATAMQTTTGRGKIEPNVQSPYGSTDVEATDKKPISSAKRLARLAGVFYLFVGIFGGFAEGFVDPKMYVAGHAATTAENVIANSGLVRMGVVAHLLDATFFVFVALTLYVVFRHVRKSVARAMLVLVALASGIIALNAVFQFEGLRVATDS